jgi:hypothetical protein
MKHIQFVDLVAILQNSFTEDLLEKVADEEIEVLDVSSFDNPLAGYLMVRTLDDFDPGADNDTKLDTFYTMLEDTRAILDGIELSLDNWEEYVDGVEVE